MAIVKEGPDVNIFTHPSALTKLALWVGEAVREQEVEMGKGGRKRGLPLVVAALNEWRGVYVVVGTGTGASNTSTKIKVKKPKEKIKPAKPLKFTTDGDEEEEEEDEEEEDDDDDDSEEDEDDERNTAILGRNKFGIAFQEVSDETATRVRIDSFEACVVEVRKEDLAGFLESLSMKSTLN